MEWLETDLGTEDPKTGKSFRMADGARQDSNKS